MKSQAVVNYGAPLQEIVQQLPTLSGSEVLIKISHCGVCHSDIHLHDGYFGLGDDKKLDISGSHSLPLTLGHEIEGEVAALGPQAQAQGVNLGDKRVVFPWIGCGECVLCERGDEHLCSKPQALGVNVAGGYSEYVVVPHPRYLLAYDNIADGLAATYMCSGITADGALQKLGPIAAGETVVIVGLGGVGMMGLQFARALFPEAAITGADVDATKLQAATEAGADRVYDVTEQGAAKQLLKDTAGGALGAVDFVGSESSSAFANRAVKKGGHVVIVGLFGGRFTMPIPMFPLRAISISGSYVGSLAETKAMLDLVKAGKIAPIPIQERPLAQADQTLTDLRAGKIVGRVVLKCND